MDDTTKARLDANLANGWRMASNWVQGVAGMMFAIYLALPPDQLATLNSHLPVPAWALPITTSVIGIVARLWPQKSITPPA